MKIDNNCVVSMFYELRDNNTNSVLESNLNAEPMSFIVGKHQLLDSLEAKLIGLEAPVNEDIVIAMADAMGTYDEEAIEKHDLEQFAGIELKVGMELFGEGEDGSTVRVIVKEIGDDTVTVDYNHPYAGKDLHFILNILECREASEDELLTGVVANPSSCGCGSSKGHDHGHGGHGGCGGGGGGCCGGH